MTDLAALRRVEEILVGWVNDHKPDPDGEYSDGFHAEVETFQGWLNLRIRHAGPPDTMRLPLTALADLILRERPWE